MINDNVGRGYNFDFAATTLRGAKMIVKREFIKNPNIEFTIGFGEDVDLKQYDKWTKTVCEDTVNGWRQK